MKRFFNKNILTISLMTILFSSSISEFVYAENFISKGEFISDINEAFEIYTTYGSQFDDIKKEDKYYYEFMAAKTQGYLKGDGTEKINPDKAITRQEAAVTLERLIPASSKKSNLKINDELKISSWAKEPVSKILSLEFMKLDEDNNFNPLDSITKKEMDEIISEIKKQKLNSNSDDEILKISSFDGYTLEGRLSIPNKKEKVDKLVVFVNGSGPNTYLNTRESEDMRFKYYDYFKKDFAKIDTAFFLL